MEFDFLPNLPKSNLDDRTFHDLVDECLLRIPRYCPEWTHYNPSDPGITFIELFAWLTDQMMMRFNQVPRRNFVVFLELLGVRLQAAIAAQSELTFYLSAALPQVYQIPAGTELATVRTDTEDAIVFSTDQPLTIGQPRILHLLTAPQAEAAPQQLRDRLSNLWTQQSDGLWAGRSQNLFEERPQPGNCFYVVLDPSSAIAGNVLALRLRGEVATSIGINPDAPPRRWEAWNGHEWRMILRQESDDQTRGFSFDEVGQPALNPIQEADVILHLPLQLPVTYFSTYQGYWLRCVYVSPLGPQSGYSRSPQILGCGVRSIGGSAIASQCSLIQDELVGNSDGTPGQTFGLQSTQILARREGEHLLVIPPHGLPEVWQEVSDFADSQGGDRHYTLDSLTGEIQFGPLIREPSQLRQQMQFRARTQARSRAGEEIPITALQTLAPSLEPSPVDSALTGPALERPALERPALERPALERQYGAIPPRGALLRMVAYRTGGGAKGNVQPGSLQIPKTAIPYVDRVTNHQAARYGADAESLEEAVIRVPRLLRTRDRAVTPEDFETLTLQAGNGAIARVCCPTPERHQMQPGLVQLLVVPQTSEGYGGAYSGAYSGNGGPGEGIAPDQLRVTPTLNQQVLDYLDERKLLGVQVQLQEPTYVGVSVQAEVGLDPQYNQSQAQQLILSSLQQALYRFLNPLSGGSDGKGWGWGCPLYPSDIIQIIQRTMGVRYVGAVLLFELRRQANTWTRTLSSTGVIDPGPGGLICSWADPQLRSNHSISWVG
jgi:predicted phage baseplate assembly protein